MAISDKLLTTAQSCLDIRQAIKEIDPKKGAGNITTLDDDLSLIVTRPKMMVVCKVTDNDGFHYEALMFDSDNGSFPSMTSSNANLPGPIICVLIESNSTSSPSFSGQSELKQVFFPDTISTFGSLSNCSSLTEIIIPKSTTSLSVNFQGCSSLKYVDMSSVTGSIASYIFENCTSLESVKLGVSQNQRTITGLFRDCSSLEKIYGLENFKFSAYNFINCSKLSEIHVSSIENFLKNSMLATSAGYTSPFAASSAESRGIYINNTLVTDIIVPDTITSIQTWAFNKVNTIQSVTFHNTLTKIGTEAFKGCTELTGDLIIPSSVTSIGSSAFSGCNKLTGSVIIPNCSVASNAFNGCRLTNLTMKATTMVSIAGTGDNTGTATIIGNVTSGLHNSNNATTRFPHINIIGNVVLFVPFGFLFSLIYSKGGLKQKKTLLVTLMVSVLLCLLIELLQLVTKVGVFDVDDIIMNTTGTFIGYIIFRVSLSIARRRKIKAMRREGYAKTQKTK